MLGQAMERRAFLVHCVLAFVVIVLSVLGPGEAGRSWLLEQYPNPQAPEDVYRCGRGGKKSFVCDPDGLLTHNQAELVDGLIMENCAETTCACPECKDLCNGYSIAVALVNRFNLEIVRKPDEEAIRWGSTLRHHQWRYGSCEDAIVIVISLEDNIFFTSIGMEAELKVTDKCINKVRENVQPYLDKGDYGTALIQTVEEYNLALLGRSCGNGVPDSVLMSVALGCVLGGLMLGGIAFCLVREMRRRKLQNSLIASTSSRQLETLHFISKTFQEGSAHPNPAFSSDGGDNNYGSGAGGSEIINEDVTERRRSRHMKDTVTGEGYI